MTVNLERKIIVDVNFSLNFEKIKEKKTKQKVSKVI